jgi:hypothetical protein
MNRFYIIAPSILLILFGGIFWQNSKTAEARAAQLAAERAAIEQTELQKKEESERKAREDAEKRAATREAEEKKKEDDRRLKYETSLAQLAEETARHQTQFAASTAEIASLEKQLAALHADRDRRNGETFEAARETELLAIKKRSAELEIQRLVKILAAQTAPLPYPNLPSN